MLDVLIVAFLLTAIVLTLPRWNYSRNWGPLPAAVSGGLLLAFLLYWYGVSPLFSG